MIFKRLKLKYFIKLLFCIFTFTTSIPSYADIDELYNLSIGTNISTFDSGFSINSESGKDLKLENSLGFDDKVNVGWISAKYRVGDRHRIRLTYTPIRRDSTQESTKDIVIDNTTIKAGAKLASKSSNDILDFSYIYSFYKTPKLEAGFSAGIYWLLSSTQVAAIGDIIAEGETVPTFQSDYNTEQKLQAPMPLIGLSINYELTPSWRSNASLRAFDVQINEINGSIFSLEAGSEYYFNNNWGIGASISTFDLDVDINRLITSSTLGWKHNGIQLYAVFKY